MLSIGLRDFRETYDKASICSKLAYDDLKLRYKRTVFGPFWATLLAGVNFFLLTLVFGTIFSSNSSHYIPFLCIGLIFWQFIASVLSEGGNIFTDSKGLMQSVNLPYSLYATILTLRHFIVLAHNFLIVVVVLLIFPKEISWYTLLVFPALLMWGITSFSLIIVIGIFSARFNDIKQLINMVVSAGFLMTPIIWEKSFLTKYSWIIDFNPIYHYISVVRQPLLGIVPSLLSFWIVSLLTLFFFLLAAFCLSKFKHRIQFWL